MSASLEWLVSATEADKAELRSLENLFEQPEISGQALSTFEKLISLKWAPPQIRRVAELVRKLLADQQKLNDARAAGFAHVRILIVSNNTIAHAFDQFTAAFARHGILLHVEAVEYQEPELVLGSAQSRYDAVLLMLDRKAWGLEPKIGGPEASVEQTSFAVDRAEKLANQCIANVAPTVLFQTLPTEEETFQSQIDLGTTGSLRRLIAHFNLDLSQLASRKGHVVLDLAALSAILGREQWRAGRYGHLAKFPFSALATEYVADALARLLAAKSGKSRRALILDLDNTLWSGVIGDDGLEGIQMSVGSPVGEAHRAIQQIALDAYRRGIVLCVASKNTFDVAIEAFRNHPDMLIPEEAVSVFKINWRDKAANIREIADTLDLGLSAFVFLDDNPAERLQVRTELPQVAVPELPADPADWPHLLALAGYFEQTSVTKEDLQRSAFYAANAKRAEAKDRSSDIGSYLASLDMQLEYRPFDALGRARIAQLISKSNQFNLTTRRYSEQEIAELETNAEAVTLQLRLKDRFGDNGMIGAVIATAVSDDLAIDLWIMSCRVLSRNVEQATLDLLVNHAHAAGKTGIAGIYIPTPRNGIVKDHYERLGFSKLSEEADGTTKWILKLESYEPFAAAIDCHAG